MLRYSKTILCVLLPTVLSCMAAEDIYSISTRTSELLYHHLHAAVHRNVVSFELVRALNHILLPQKFHDNILNSSTVIVINNTHTHKWTLLKTTHLATLSLHGQ